jgi:branched-chain amino acid transport system substrate-binding protein
VSKLRKLPLIFLVTAIITILALILNGCSNSSPTTAPTTNAPTQTSPQTSKAAVTTSASASPIKIGFIIPMSGPYAASLVYFQPAIQMVIDKFNAAGGVLGRQIQLVATDSQGDPSKIAQIADQMKAAGCVGIIGELLDPSCLALEQWAGTNHIPAMILSDSQEVTTTNFNKYSFHVDTPVWAIGNAMIDVITTQTAVKSIYTLGGDISFVHFIYNMMWPEANNPLYPGLNKTRPDIKNLGVTWADLTKMDFSNDISAVLAKKPDMVYSGLGGPPYINFVKQAQQFDLFKQVKFLGTFTSGADAADSFGKDFPSGIQTVTWCPLGLQDKTFQDFVQAFYTKAKVYPFDHTIAYYLGAEALLESIQKSGSTEPDKMVAALENTSVDSPLGPIFVDDYSHQFHIPQWYAESGYVSGINISAFTNLRKLPDSMYPTKDIITTLRTTATSK